MDPKTGQRRIIFTTDAKLSVFRKTASAAEPAAADAGMATLTGYPLVWNVLSSDRGGFKVRLLPNSATFAQSTLALFNHDAGRVLGNNANGTLRIMPPDNFGVKVEIDLPNTSDGRDAEELVEKKYITGMSFAMVNAPQGEMVTEGGEEIFNASAYLVDEVTITGIPAFTQTSVVVAKEQPAPDYAVRRDHALKFETLRFSSLRLPI